MFNGFTSRRLYDNYVSDHTKDPSKLSLEEIEKMTSRIDLMSDGVPPRKWLTPEFAQGERTNTFVEEIRMLSLGQSKMITASVPHITEDPFSLGQTTIIVSGCATKTDHGWEFVGKARFEDTWNFEPHNPRAGDSSRNPAIESDIAIFLKRVDGTSFAVESVEFDISQRQGMAVANWSGLTVAAQPGRVRGLFDINAIYK